MSDLPLQYAEGVETFTHILDLPNPREILPISSTTVVGLDDEKGQQELRPRGLSAMLPLNPILKDVFEKFEQDFLASNLPEGKYIKRAASTAKYYKVGQPLFEDILQELNTDFAKICISPKPSGTCMGKTCFDCKMFDVANWVACLNGENGPRGPPSHEALSVS